MEGLSSFINHCNNIKFADGDSTIPEEALPEWIVVGESVLIRPYNSSGVISFIGTTEFATGVWIGVELDAPTGIKPEPLNQLPKYFAVGITSHFLFYR